MKTQRSLIDIFAEHKLASNMLMVILIFFGIWGLSNINTQLNPNQSFHQVEVNVSWPGASAEDVENLVTKPIELQLRGLSYLDRITSRTTTSYTRIRLRFENAADMGTALDEVKQNVSQIRNLPNDIEPPVIRKSYYKELIAGVLISGPETLDELTALAQQYEKELLTEGIDSVTYRALPEEEISIEISSQKLFELGTSLDQIAVQLLGLSQDVPSGTIGHGQVTRQLRGLDQQRDVQGFAHLPVQIGDSDAPLVQLQDIAHIERKIKDNEVSATRYGKPAIWLRVERNPSTDTMEIAETLHNWYEKKQAQLPPGTEVTLFLEAWKFAADQLNLVLSNGISGVFLVIFALYLFLNGRVAWWVTVGMPVSFITAISLFYMWGGTINFLSMIGLVMALGIVVDDAIVVGEYSASRFEAGDSPIDAARNGAKRMFSPVMASSLTTLAAFLPLILVDSDSVREIPMLMVCVIIASIVECFLIMPGHLRDSFSKMQHHKPSRFRAAFDKRFDYFREHMFMPALDLAMHNRRATIGIALSAFLIAISLLMSGRIKTELNLNLDFEYLEASVQFPSGTSEAERQRVITKLERTLNETDEALGGGNIVDFLTNINMGYIDHEYKSGYQYVNLLVELTSPDTRTISLHEFSDAWRERVGRDPAIEQLQISNGSDFGSDLSIILKGGDVQTLKTAAEEVATALRNFAGVSNVYDNLPWGNEQWIFSLTPEGRALGLTASNVGKQIRAAYEGYRIQIFNVRERELEVRVKLPEEERKNLGVLQRFPILTPNGEIVPLATVAQIQTRRGIDTINHHNAQLAVSIQADVDRKKNTPMAVLNGINEEILPDILDRYGLTSGLGGSSADEAKVMQDLLMGALMGMGLIYIILCWVLSSYTWPLAVMMAIPLAFTGALFGLQLSGLNLGVMSIMGLFTLAGVIINDSIILVTTFRHFRLDGMTSIQAIEAAARSRLRAVILTSLTTTLGLAPMLLESSPMGEIMAPLAVIIVFGMLYGTLLILFVIPVTLSIIETLTERHAHRKAQKLEKRQQVQATASDEEEAFSPSI